MVRFHPCFQTVPGQPREQCLELALPNVAAEIFWWHLICPQLLMGLQMWPWGHSCCALSGTLMRKNHWAGTSKTYNQPCRMPWKDSGISLVLNDRIQQQDLCSAMETCRGAGWRKNSWVSLLQGVCSGCCLLCFGRGLLTLWHVAQHIMHLLRGAGPGTRGSFGAIQYTALAACTFFFSNMN